MQVNVFDHLKVFQISLLGILEQFIEDQPVDLIVVAQAGERVGWHLAEGGPVLKITRPVKTRYINCAVKHFLVEILLLLGRKGCATKTWFKGLIRSEQ